MSPKVVLLATLVAYCAQVSFGSRAKDHVSTSPGRNGGVSDGTSYKPGSGYQDHGSYDGEGPINVRDGHRNGGDQRSYGNNQGTGRHYRDGYNQGRNRNGHSHHDGHSHGSNGPHYNGHDHSGTGNGRSHHNGHDHSGTGNGHNHHNGRDHGSDGHHQHNGHDHNGHHHHDHDHGSTRNGYSHPNGRDHGGRDNSRYNGGRNGQHGRNGLGQRDDGRGHRYDGVGSHDNGGTGGRRGDGYVPPSVSNPWPSRGDNGAGRRW